MNGLPFTLAGWLDLLKRREKQAFAAGMVVGGILAAVVALLMRVL